MLGSKFLITIFNTTASATATVVFSRIFVVISISLLVVILCLLFLPPSTMIIPPSENPSKSFDDAIKKLSLLQALDNESINPRCHTKAFLHGNKTNKVIVLFHGFTNCPAQFDILGKQLFDQGYNVLIPRIPTHGKKDRLSNEPSRLTHQILVDFVHATIDIATGLGDNISVMGLSGGGVLAGYAAHYRSEVSNALLAAPLFMPAGFDKSYHRFLINTLTLLPNIFSWWDSTLKDNISGPQYAYPRYSTKGILAFEKMSYELIKDVQRTENYSIKKNLTLVLVDGDQAVNNKAIKKDMQVWVQNKNVNYTEYTFAKKLGLGHDFIDPNQPNAKIDIAYPKIINLLQLPQ